MGDEKPYFKKPEEAPAAPLIGLSEELGKPVISDTQPPSGATRIVDELDIIGMRIDFYRLRGP